MLVKTFGSAVYGIKATTITIEVNVGQGINFFIVGLPDNAVKESHQRMLSAIQTSGFHWPGKRIVINMAPADIRKEGSAYDLPLAVGILAATDQVKVQHLEEFIIMGELSLDGGIHPIKGVLPIAINARDDGFKGLILPQANAREAAVVAGLEVYGVEDIRQVVDFLSDRSSLEPTIVNTEEEFATYANSYDVDFSDVKGQENVKRALEIAAAGGHNIIMVGPPGAGKTMLRRGFRRLFHL